MNAPRFRQAGAPLAVAAGVVALHLGAIRTGFLNDDYLFLEEAQRRTLFDAIAHPQALANYFRPLSRQVWFALLAPAANPLLFHLGQLAAFLLAAWLLLDLLGELAPPAAALAGVAWFVALPLQRVNLTWISCAQDLFALAGTLGALALYRRGRDVPAAVVWLAALLSKESSLPLPALLYFWSRRVDGAPPRAAWARLRPFAPAFALWLAGETWLRHASPGPAQLHFGPVYFAAAYVHMLQSLVGLDHPAGLAQALALARPSAAAFALLAAAAFWLPAAGARTAAAPPAATRAAAPAAPAPAAGPARVPARVAVAFALLWLAAFGFVTGPVAHVWSAYYYTLCAVGGAVLVALLARRLARWGWVAFAAALVAWNAVGVAAPAFAVVENPWGWTSHLTPWYFARGAALSARLAAALGRAVPHPRPGTRFFFATLPPWAGFQTGNGPAIRHFYRDPSLESWFYSQFSDTTAGDHPCVFLYWNGADFEPLYAHARDPMFQVGADLLLLERPAGAAHAFRRALAAGGDPRDDLYWLGWAFLWSDHRAAAEQAWRAFGAKDDSSAHTTWLTAARTAVADRDTLAARRALVEAIRAGIGRPVAHAELAALLRGVNAKYALLETLVAARLDPADWLARRDLVDGLVAAHLDEVAGRELLALQRIEPRWAADTVTARLAATLGGRSLAGRAVAEFGSVPAPEVGR